MIGRVVDRASDQGTDESRPPSSSAVRSSSNQSDHAMSQAAPDVGPAREEETLTRLLVEQMPALLWSTDRDLKLTSWMGGLAQLVPDAHRAVGLTLFEFFHTQDETFRPIASHRRALAGESVLYEGDWMGRTLATH